VTVSLSRGKQQQQEVGTGMAVKPGPKSNVSQPRARTRQTTPPPTTITSVVKSAYSLDRVFTESTDSKGHYEQIRSVKITPAIEVLIMQAVDDNLDYRNSTQAFVRDAIVHRLHYLHTNPGSTIDRESLAQELIRVEMLAIQAKDKAVEDQCRMLEETTDICIAAENFGVLNSLLDKISENLAEIDYPAGHRRQLEDALDYAFQSMASGRAPRRSR
jgi:hypothetical protein